ncbi:MAG: hypothetical protein C0591_11070, partial [Marinilabiliales bacterium]
MKKLMDLSAKVLFAAVIILIAIPYKSISQEINLAAKDTTLLDPKTIDLSEISRKSAELTLATKEIVNQAIENEKLNSLKLNNSEIIHYMDSLLERETYVNMTTLSVRNLNSKLNYWEQNLKTVKGQQSNLAQVFQELNESHLYLKNELELWEKTDELIQGDELAKAVHKHFVENKMIIDTTKTIIDQKSVAILNLLDRITSLEVE